MATGLKMIKKELGPDALILSTKTVRNGKLGLLSKPMLEITAAVDTDFHQKQNDGSSGKASSFRAQASVQKKQGHDKKSFKGVVNDPVEQFLEPTVQNDESSPQPFPAELECFREYPTVAPKKPAAAPEDELAANRQSRESKGLESEVSELKQLVKDLAGQITHLHQNKTEPVPAEATGHPHSEITLSAGQFTKRTTVDQIHGDHLLSLLLSKGINVETARIVSGFIRERLTQQELGDISIVTAAIIETLQNLIEVNSPDFTNENDQRRIALVGPTGVGKTTTLAKIAASYLQRYSGSIALITIDTYRIAAVEQLKVYGEIMHLPVDVVITPEQLSQALQKHQDKKLILIDTAGRSPRDSFCIDELSTFLPPEHNIEKHLVVSASTRENELMETIQQFARLDIANTIFTKIDECLSLGVLLNTQLQNSTPVSYITNGQRVPEDILEITPQKVAELIMSKDQGSMHE